MQLKSYNFNKYSIDDFKIKLSHETWDNGFTADDVNKIFNNFHNTFKYFVLEFCQKQSTGKKKKTLV